MNKKRKKKKTHPRKVKKTWRPRLFCHLLSTRIEVCILDDGLHHLNNVLLMRKKTMHGPLGDGLVTVIKPLPAPWLGLEGDNFFCLLPTRMTDPFLRGQLAFPSFFLFNDPFPMTLGADVDAPSFSFLQAAADVSTKALCLVASISAKGKWRKLDKKTGGKWKEEVRK